jgi:hypothetical protein
MSYTIRLFDKTEIVVSNAQAMALNKSLASGSDGFVTVNGSTIKKSAIASVTPGGQTQADQPGPAFGGTIAVGLQCRGQYSIQREINRIASDRPDWSKLIRDLSWREKTRTELLRASNDWCDYKTGACRCGPTYRSTEAKHRNVANRIGKKLD